ncbi:hypothetical protein Tco_0362852 [Tanacetum coccineum]
MVAYLEKSEGSEGFHQIIDFLTASHIKNALTECPNLYASLIEQFWQTAALSTTEDGVRGITATIDRKVKVFVSEASIRRHLKLEDFEEKAFSPQKEPFHSPPLHKKLFSNRKGLQGYSGVDIPLFPTMLTTPESSPSRITSSPSLSPQTHSSTLQPPSTPPSNQTTPITKEAAPIPHESPLQRGSGILTGRNGESELKQTKQTYNAALTKLIKRVKKLEQTIKINQARRRAKVVISDDEEAEEDPSNQGRSLIEELDLDAGISLAITLADAAIRRQSVENVQTYTRRRKEVSTGSCGVITASRLVSTADISTASELDSTAGVKAKDKGKEEQARFNAERKARFKAEQEQERIDFETALELQKQLDEREEVAAKAFIPMGFEIEKEVMKRSGFDLQQESSKPVEEEIVQQDDVIAEQAVKESSRTAGGRRKKSLARKRARETLSEESAKKQKLEDDTEKEELQVYLNIVPEDESLDVESLATKYPIVDWETQILANDKYYYQIKRADGSVKHYKLFSAMLYDFDRQDVLELYRLVKERFQIASPEGYDLLLWGDLKTLIEPNEEDEIWRNQQDWNLINWKLHNFCGVYVLLMDTGFVIHMMVEKKYPLSQDTLSKMLSRRLEVDHQSEMGYELIRFVKS